MKGVKTVSGDIQGSGTASTDNNSWTRRAARVVNAARVVGAARVVSEARVKGIARVEAAGAMKCTNPGYGHPSEHTVQAGDVLRKTGPASRQAPAPTVTNKVGMLGTPHIQRPPGMKCPNS